jgi:hypothetical protein
MKFIIALGKILVLGFAVGVISSLGKTSPYAALFRWDGSLLIRCVEAMVLLVGIPASVCALTRRTRSAWLAVLVLAGAMLIAPWADMWSDHFKAANSGRVFTASLDGTAWEPLMLTAIMVIPMFLMRRFIPAFRRYAAVA